MNRGPRLSTALLLSALAVLGCGDDDRRPLADTGAADMSPSDAGSRDGSADSALPDGSAPDASLDGASPDASPADGGTPDADESMAQVDLTFAAGCSPDFGGDVVVVTNSESIAVSSTSGGALTGSIQLDLDDVSGTVMLSTRHRVDTGAVVNVIVGTTWTNIAMDSSGVLSGDVEDPIGGTLRIDGYSRAEGTMDLTFTGVTLQNPSDGTICRVDGRLQTFGRSF